MFETFVIYPPIRLHDVTTLEDHNLNGCLVFLMLVFYDEGDVIESWVF
jgi:hypothetical protein